MVRIIIALAALVAVPAIALAQQQRIYAGGGLQLVTATHSDNQPIGGTTLGGSALFGVRIAPHVGIEFEPSFDHARSDEYTYRPAASLLATVVASRRDTFYPVQARFALGVLEPVIGVGLVHSEIARHATIGNTSYFDDGRSENHVAVVGGLDAAVKLASHVYFVPTLRVLVVARGAGNDPLGEQTSTGALVFRYGAGARVTF